MDGEDGENGEDGVGENAIDIVSGMSKVR